MENKIDPLRAAHEENIHYFFYKSCFEMFLVFENKMENRIDPLMAAHEEFIDFVDKIFFSYLFEDFG
jgi:hypothetical protein